MINAQQLLNHISSVKTEIVLLKAAIASSEVRLPHDHHFFDYHKEYSLKTADEMLSRIDVIQDRVTKYIKTDNSSNISEA